MLKKKYYFNNVFKVLKISDSQFVNLISPKILKIKLLDSISYESFKVLKGS